jgi:hypothetical protein
MKACAICLLVLTSVIAAQAQGTFRNLDFELANVPLVPAGQFGADVPISQGLPGWSAFYNGNPTTSIWHNNVTLGGAEIGILGPAWDSSQILQGSYSVMLQQSFAGQPTSAAIAQTGLIPSTARSLTFFASPTSLFQVTFAGHVIPLTQIGSGANYIIEGGDVSQFAGQTGELRFTAGTGILDNIQFSSNPVPEPATGAFVVFGGLLFGFRNRLTAHAANSAMNILLHSERQQRGVAGAQRYALS